MITDNEKKTLRYLMVHAPEMPSINKIAKDVGLAPNGAYKILKKFENEGILKYRSLSNIKAYSLDYSNPKTKSFLELALSPAIPSKRVEHRINDLSPLKKITEAGIIFGSYLSDKKDPNDLDVLFIINDMRGYKQELESVREISPVKIHDIIQTEKDLIDNIKNRDNIILGIIEKGIVLWGYSRLIEGFSFGSPFNFLPELIKERFHPLPQIFKFFIFKLCFD